METGEIFELFDKFDKSTLSEVIISQGDLRVTFRKAEASSGFQIPAPTSSGHTVHRPGTERIQRAISEHGAQAGGKDGEVITSPIVGTFYRAPSPDSPPFVEPGQRVDKGQTLCVIEAMKVMNELQAELACEILEVLVENGTMIEFGTPLFRVRS